MFIPKIALDIGREELLALFNAYEIDRLKFARKLSQYLKVDNNLFLFNRGRVALSEALKVLGVKQGDEVIIPAFCCRAVVESVINCKAIPVLLDVNPKSMIIDIDKLKYIISPRTKVVIVIKTYGLPISYEIFKLIHSLGLLVVLDSAHSLTWDFNFKNNTYIPDAVIFSFGFDKPITTGYGGALWIKDNLLLQKYIEKYLSFLPEEDIQSFLKIFIELIFSYINVYSNKYLSLFSALIQQVQQILYKKKTEIMYKKGTLLKVKRMGKFAASIGLWQLRRLPKMQKQRIKNAQFLYEFLKTLQVVEYAPNPQNYPFLRYPVLLRNISIRNNLLMYLKKIGIGANISVWPKIIIYDSWVKEKAKVNFKLLSGAIELTKKFLLLPVHPKVGHDHLRFIMNAIKKFEEGNYNGNNKSKMEKLL